MGSLACLVLCPKALDLIDAYAMKLDCRFYGLRREEEEETEIYSVKCSLTQHIYSR